MCASTQCECERSNLSYNYFLNLTKMGFVNIHGSILPKWRGAAPIQRSIMNLDTETGISIMKLTNTLDGGPVCNIYKICKLRLYTVRAERECLSRVYGLVIVAKMNRKGFETRSKV